MLWVFIFVSLLLLLLLFCPWTTPPPLFPAELWQKRFEPALLGLWHVKAPELYFGVFSSSAPPPPPLRVPCFLHLDQWLHHTPCGNQSNEKKKKSKKIFCIYSANMKEHSGLVALCDTFFKLNFLNGLIGEVFLSIHVPICAWPSSFFLFALFLSLFNLFSTFTSPLINKPIKNWSQITLHWSL